MKSRFLPEDLAEAVDKFEKFRIKRLEQTEKEGFGGWHLIHFCDIPDRLLKKAAKLATGKMTKKDCADVANFANFIFDYLSKKEAP